MELAGTKYPMNLINILVGTSNAYDDLENISNIRSRTQALQWEVRMPGAGKAAG